MFYIIETEKQLQQFDNHKFKEAFIHIIPLNYNFHPALTSISLIYIRPFKSHKGYIICIDTDESFSLNLNKVFEILSTFDVLYVLDKKEALYYLPNETNLFDLKLQIDINKPELPIFRHYYNLYPYVSDVNKLIPISKHYEYCEELYDSISFEDIDISLKWYKFYNTYAILSFYLIERQGITTDVEKIKHYFKTENLTLNIKEKTIYTKYNLYNITSRPSNSFNGINFSALNKENGCKTSFISQYDGLMEMDYDSFHIRLLGKLIGYEFSNENIHEYLGKQYFNTDKLTPEQYKESKGITFKILYTEKRIEEYLHIEFFQKVKKYKEIKWAEYQEQEYITSEISNKPLSGITQKTKLLPYILQNYETELNIVKLYKILRLLKDKKTKLIFYNYDSITLDVFKDDGKELIIKIKEIMESDGFPVKIKFGESLDFS